MATLLVVDDEPQILKLLVRLLSADYTVITAESGIEGLAVYESYSNRIDLIITDITMPNMTGLELVDRLEALHGRRLPVIFISAASDFPVEPCRTVVRKPFTPAQIKRAVETVLRECGR
jgi:CheY-like chemotaxis protein